jgi:hypothetical protein
MSLNNGLYHFTLPDHPSSLFKYCSTSSFFGKQSVLGYKLNSGKGTSKTFVGKLVGNKPHTRHKRKSSTGLLVHVIELHNFAVREKGLDKLEEYSVK